MNDVAQNLSELLNSAGSPASGFRGSIQEGEQAAILAFPNKPFCLVRDWRLIEVEVADAYKQALARDGLSPFVLYASDVVSHSTGKRQTGDWVRTTFQQSLTKGFLFESVNTVYVMLGAGLRIKASADAVLAIGQ
jgi:hypothetical protein